MKKGSYFIAIIILLTSSTVIHAQSIWLQKQRQKNGLLLTKINQKNSQKSQARRKSIISIINKEFSNLTNKHSIDYYGIKLDKYYPKIASSKGNAKDLTNLIFQPLFIRLKYKLDISVYKELEMHLASGINIQFFTTLILPSYLFPSLTIYCLYKMLENKEQEKRNWKRKASNPISTIIDKLKQTYENKAKDML